MSGVLCDFAAYAAGFGLIWLVCVQAGVFE